MLYQTVGKRCSYQPHSLPQAWPWRFVSGRPPGTLALQLLDFPFLQTGVRLPSDNCLMLLLELKQKEMLQSHQSGTCQKSTPSRELADWHNFTFLALAIASHQHKSLQVDIWTEV